MPRPKVRPEDRQRAVKACVPCKNSKKRCDSRTPCSNCCRRDCESACTYDDDGYVRSRPSQSRRATASIGIDGRRRDMVAPSMSIDGHSIDMDSVMYHDSMNSHAPHTPESTLAPCSDATPGIPTSPRLPMAHGEVPSGRTMLNSKGEKGESESTCQHMQHQLTPAAGMQSTWETLLHCLSCTSCDRPFFITWVPHRSRTTGGRM